MKSSPFLACLLCVSSAKPAAAAIDVTLPTATSTGRVVFTRDISFTITEAGVMGWVVFDEWVDSDGSRTGFLMETPHDSLLYSLNGGPTEERVINHGALVDNFASSVGELTPNDGFFGANDIGGLFLPGDVFILKAATYILPMASRPAFNPQANQIFTGNAFLVNARGERLSETVSIGAIPEPSCAFLCLGGLLTLVFGRRNVPPR